jgi:PIN domain nuclease of toxin-antitoxin system
VRLLLDTHVVLWGFTEPDRISTAAREAMASRQNRCFVSLASLWEIAIKTRKGQLSAQMDLPGLIEANQDLRPLPISVEHVWRVRRLPRLHGDPFDHLLISQALCEDMILVTHDRAMGDYGVDVLPT